LLTEAVLLAVAGGMAGLLLALAIVRLVPAFAPATIPRINEVSIDTSTLLFTMAVVFFVGTLVGLAPAVHAMRVEAARTLAEGGTQVVGGFGFTRGNRTRLVVLVGELALALTLLVGAGLLVKSFARLSRRSHRVHRDPSVDSR
jgi:putative ABC transport system permease protein